MQALNAWLVGHDHGLLLQGPDPDSPEPVPPVRTNHAYYDED
jgi:hypothetical protein